MKRSKYVTTYRGMDIYLDDDNSYHVKLKSKDYEFDSLEDAEEFIDDVPANVRYQVKDKKPKLYYIYVTGTYKNHRAKYLCKDGKSEFRNESQADKFTGSRMNAILRNSTKYSTYSAN